MGKFVKKSQKQFSQAKTSEGDFPCYMCSAVYAHHSSLSKHTRKEHGAEYLMPRGGHNKGLVKKKRKVTKVMGRPKKTQVTKDCGHVTKRCQCIHAL